MTSTAQNAHSKAQRANSREHSSLLQTFGFCTMWDSESSIIIHRSVALTNMFMITSSDSTPAPVALTGDMGMVPWTCQLDPDKGQNGHM
ncbi:hypothetical protein V493_05918 [Pseudogymnoascus sp. VKM F-4281 (FW-2241)]|nr:hypothetical protein V493_05918 [Pseudogymnoascus sp. VKM F-4281 (FW-2241)]